MNHSGSNDPLHGLTLETIVRRLVEHYGFDTLAELVPINCFKFEPSIRSSLKFLRRVPWARGKVEELYLATGGWDQPAPSGEPAPAPRPRTGGFSPPRG